MPSQLGLPVRQAYAFTGICSFFAKRHAALSPFCEFASAALGVWGKAPIGFPEGENRPALGAEAASAIGWAKKINFMR